MRKLRLGITLVVVSVLTLLAYRVQPSGWFEDIAFLHSVLSDIALGIIFFTATYFMGLQTLQFFRLPALGVRTLIALAIASFFVVAEITGSDNIHLGMRDTVLGILFLLGTGFSEEMFSRAFMLGVLYKFGRKSAIFFSSLVFGLMHLNLYVGSEWNPWHAYWHVVNAASFGVFICTLMIVTRSIWVGVIFHALVDWGIVFDKELAPLPAEKVWHPAFWEGLSYPLSNCLIYLGLAAFLLQIDRGSAPAWVYPLAVKCKLVTPQLQYVAH